MGDNNQHSILIKCLLSMGMQEHIVRILQMHNKDSVSSYEDKNIITRIWGIWTKTLNGDMKMLAGYVEYVQRHWLCHQT